MSSRSMPDLQDEDSAYQYMCNVCGRLHKTTQKLSNTKEDLDVWMRRRGFAQSEQNRKKIQVAPTLYVETETADSFSGQM